MSGFLKDGPIRRVLRGPVLGMPDDRQSSYEQSMMVERSVLEEYADKIADKVIRNYRDHLMKQGRDLGGKGEWMVRELVKKKVTYVAYAKVNVTQKELDALFRGEG